MFYQLELNLYQIMCKKKIHTAFSNMEAILRLFLSLMVTNCSGKRSFSRFKSIKNKLRSTMSQESWKQLHLALLKFHRLTGMLGNAIANLGGVISEGRCCDLGNFSRTRLSVFGPT